MKKILVMVLIIKLMPQISAFVYSGFQGILLYAQVKLVNSEGNYEVKAYYGKTSLIDKEVSFKDNIYECMIIGNMYFSEQNIYIEIYKDNKVIDSYNIVYGKNSPILSYDCKTREFKENKFEGYYNEEFKKINEEYYKDDRTLGEKIWDFIEDNFKVIFRTIEITALLLLLIGFFIKYSNNIRVSSDKKIKEESKWQEKNMKQ